MPFPDGVDVGDFAISRIVRKTARDEFGELWRELARPVTLFDLCSPSIFFSIKNRRIL